MELNELYHKYNIRTDGFERRYVISINDRRYDMDFVTPIELNILVDKEPRNLSDYLVIEGSNPINKNFKNRSWVQLFKQLLDFLQEYNPKANEELLAFRPEWSGSVPFREEKFVNSIEVPGGLYMNVNFTATHSLWFLWDLLNFYDIHCAQISVHRPPVAEPDEIKEAVEKTRKEEFKKFLISKCDRDEEGAQRVLKGIDSLNKLLCAQKSCSNYGDITTSGSGAGGIAGLINSDVSSTFSFTDCYSSGTVTTSAGWAGGLFGYAGKNSIGTINFTNVLSASKVVDNSATGNVGGFMAGQDSTAATFNLVKCQSMTSISYSGSNAFSTGIALSKTNIVADDYTNLAVNDKEHGVELSDTTIKLLRAIREFNCSYDSTMASIVSAGVDNLTPEEIDVLFLTIHYGANDYAETYYGSALYINEYLSNNVSGLNRIIPGITNNNAVLIAIIVCISAILGSLSLLLLRKRKRI